MKALFKIGLALLTMLGATPVLAGDPPVPTATVRVPQCLQFSDPATYKPCLGVVPADLQSGNALDWSTLIKGSPTNPTSASPIVNNAPVSSTNPIPTIDTGSTGVVGNPSPNSARLMGGKDSNGNTQILSTDTTGALNVNCSGCTGGGGGGTGTPVDNTRRTYWSETMTPLVAGDKFVGGIRDTGGAPQGGTTRWNSFGCFVSTDQQGTLYLQASNNGTTWFTVLARNISSTGGSVFLGQPLFTRYWRCTVINGTTAQTSLILNSTFGM